MEAELSSIRPPTNFQPAGVVKWARLIDAAPPFIGRSRARSGAQMQGIRYERRVHEALSKLYGPGYLPSQWLMFKPQGSMTPRWCQVDALLVDPLKGKVTIIEVKYSHTPTAWWQLYALYLPVVSAIFGPNWNYACCEVVKWYDASVACPQQPVLKKHIDRTDSEEWGLHIWNPR